MKTITQEEAIELLSNCYACIIVAQPFEPMESAIVIPTILPDDREPDTLFYAEWEEEGMGYEAHAYCANNETVRIEGDSLYLKDKEGEEMQIKLLTIQPLG
jgi:hypothetical protein